LDLEKCLRMIFCVGVSAKTLLVDIGLEVDNGIFPGSRERRGYFLTAMLLNQVYLFILAFWLVIASRNRNFEGIKIVIPFFVVRLFFFGVIKLFTLFRYFSVIRERGNGKTFLSQSLEGFRRM